METDSLAALLAQTEVSSPLLGMGHGSSVGGFGGIGDDSDRTLIGTARGVVDQSSDGRTASPCAAPGFGGAHPASSPGMLVFQTQASEDKVRADQ